MEHFGTWIRNQREMLRRTQAECARAAGMKVQYWNNLEKNVRRPEQETVQKMADALGLNAHEAMLAAGYVSGDEHLPDMTLARRLSPILLRLPPERRAKAEDAITQMAELLVSNAA